MTPDATSTSGGSTRGLVPVAGIGASAGGLQPLQAFFRSLPSDPGLAFVVVVHLSPEHESRLAEILQDSTSLRVTQVNEPVVVEADHVYVGSPGRVLSLSEGNRLAPHPIREPSQRSAPIDHFFRTLAQRHPDGIGILFSGGGSDGTLGMRAIKEEGGILLAQLPEEAEHDSMPSSIIATGLVDFVLPAEALARKVVEIARREARPVPLEAEALGRPDREALGKVLRQVRVRTGYDFTGYKRGTVLRRLGRRMRVCGTSTLPEYLEYLSGHAAECAALQKDFLISVTRFFRDEEAYRALARTALPKILGQGRNAPVRVWVPGCATGEEAYSLAMLFLEEAGSLAVSPHLQVFATDIDAEALRLAREGCFPKAIEADIAPARLERFFLWDGGCYRASPLLRESIVFAPHDLLGDAPFSRIDLVSCRNLLIYLEPEVQERVYRTFRYALQEGGFLFLGCHESLPPGGTPFHPVDARYRIYELEETRPSVSGEGEEPVPLGVRRPFVSLASVPSSASRAPEAPPAAERHRLALEEHAPPSLVVDPDYELVHSSERAGRFLRVPPGRPSANVLDAVRPELRPELHAALHEVLDEERPALSAPLPLQIDGLARLVRLHVSPLARTDSKGGALVVFLVTEAGREGGEDDQLPSAGLEDELLRTRERLQSALVALDRERDRRQGATEQLQSVTEEYTLTLEELETSKEELQSSNEELQTVNEELEGKVDALARVNGDLKNLMAATDVAVLFLDRELRVQRFTPAADRLFLILPEDVGRPLSYITHRFEAEGIVEDAERVLASQASVEREVEGEDGRTYLLRMTPYRTTEERIEGVVVTMVEVSRLREAREAYRKIAERYRLFVDNVRDYAIVMLDPEGRIADWNRGAERLFGYPGHLAVSEPGDFLYTREEREAATLRAEIERASREGQLARDRWLVRSDGSRFWGSCALTALFEEDGSLTGLVQVVHDETRWREAERARVHFQSLFESAPGLYVVLEPDSFEILAASDAYLEATMTRREDIVGRGIFEVFPDDPADPHAGGMKSLRSSLERVMRDKRADVLGVLRYPIRRPESEGGGFEERYWSPMSSPVRGPDGELTYIIHRVEDVTPFIRRMEEEGREKEGHRLLERRAEQMETEILLRAQELQQVNEELRRLNDELELRVDEQTRKVRDLAARLTLAEQTERHRIALVLHDDLQQILVGARFKMGLIGRKAAVEGVADLSERSEEISQLLERAIQTTRGLSIDLSPNILDGEGLPDALRWLATRMDEVHELRVDIDAAGPGQVPDGGLRVLLFQVVRELLFNVVKHSGAEEAKVEMRSEGGRIRLRVSDEGLGFDPAEAQRSESGSGLLHVRERVGLVGGDIRIDSAPGGGTVVEVDVPVSDDSRADSGDSPLDPGVSSADSDASSADSDASSADSADSSLDPDASSPASDRPSPESGHASPESHPASADPGRASTDSHNPSPDLDRASADSRSPSSEVDR